jgi:DNA repair exonuclease SbcCD ATPase subunit
VKAAYRALTLLCDEPKSAEPKRELDKVRQAFAESARIFGVEAFAQTKALKKAEIDTAEAKKRADGADEMRADLAKLREANASLAARVTKAEADLAKTTARATELQRANNDLETSLAGIRSEHKEATTAAETHRQRSEEAERRATALGKQLSGLERERVTQAAMKRVTSDAAELKDFAKRLTEKTELIEKQLRAQQKKTDKANADYEEARAKALSLSGELQAALKNAMALSKELAAAKEQIHAHETKAIKASAEATKHQTALTAARSRIAELEADDAAREAEVSELRAELAEAWSAARRGRRQQPVAVVVSSNGAAKDGEHDRPHGMEDDLRFERMHVEHLEHRLGTWAGLASAALRKITRLGRKPPARRPARRRLAATPATSET